jgi:CheY-like chemotaxis protein
MAREVMARLGGDITAANRAEGGAVFTLSFPIAGRKSEQPQAQAAMAPSCRRVLVIDDDADNLEALHAALAIKGHIVETASTGAEGLRKMRAGARFEVVICDIGMPGMNGWEVAQEIARLAPGITIYLLTGWAREIARDDPRRKLVAGVLAKPVDLERINYLITQ